GSHGLDLRGHRRLLVEGRQDHGYSDSRPRSAPPHVGPAHSRSPCARPAATASARQTTSTPPFSVPEKRLTTAKSRSRSAMMSGCSNWRWSGGGETTHVRLA